MLPDGPWVPDALGNVIAGREGTQVRAANVTTIIMILAGPGGFQCVVGDHT